MNRIHDSAVAARKELVANGFVSGFSSPGRPELWVNPKTKTRCAVGTRVVNDVDEQWVIVPYPEPSTAVPDEVVKLAERDMNQTDEDGACVSIHPEHCLCDGCVTPENVDEHIARSQAYLETQNGSDLL